MIDKSSIMAWNEFVPWTDYARKKFLWQREKK